MGRSEQKQVNQEATGLFNTENANAAKAQGVLMPQYQSILAHPGYTDPQKADITRATEGGIGAAFGDAEQGAVNRAGRTNNAAGLTSTEDALARQRMITSGDLAAGNEANFANVARGDRNLVLGGIGSLFGQNLQGANTTLGHQTQNAAAPSFWDQMALAGIQAGGAVGAGFASKPSNG
ncbi:MAG: hypothetical protein LAN84_04170 [Acidobacteriia bacterium]|nr:hypothetical protein [Terriglobia bacterium]